MISPFQKTCWSKSCSSKFRGGSRGSESKEVVLEERLPAKERRFQAGFKLHEVLPILLEETTN